MSAVEQRARELLAAEYENEGLTETARLIRSGMMNKHRPVDSYILRAIVAALASQAQVQVPDGWTISREGEDVRLTADGVASFLVKRSMFRGSLEEFVWLFLNEIAAAPAPGVDRG